MINYARTIESAIIDRLEAPKAIFILGARQVGKTTLLKRLMQHIGEDRSLYFDIESPRNLELFSGSIESIISFLRFSRTIVHGKTYVFLDEVQYLGDLSKTIKLLIDHHSDEFKFVMTGSSSVLIKHQFQESLVGRKEIFTLYPLSFSEYCLFREQDKIAHELETGSFSEHSPLLTLHREMEQLLADYCVFGGYPEVTTLSSQEAKIDLLNEIASSYILKDIRHILKIEKLSELNHLIGHLAHNIGKEINISDLARNIGLHRETLNKYLLGLEESYILGLVRPFSSSYDKEIRKMPKAYFIDTGIRNLLVNNFSPLGSRHDRGELIENSFFMHLRRISRANTKLRYWKTKSGAEIDFVLAQDDRINAFEVKYGTDSKNHFQSFKNQYPEASCKMIRYHYSYKESERPLWWMSPSDSFYL